jgi:outer membrane immunogenic protein
LCASTGALAFGGPAPAPGCTSGTSTGSFSQTRFGSAVGGGLQYAFAHNWSIKTEYLHWDLGRANYGLTGASLATSATIPPVFFGAAGIAPAGAVVGSTATTRITGEFVRLSENYKL